MPEGMNNVKLEYEGTETVSSKFVENIGRFIVFLRVTLIVDICRFRILRRRELNVPRRPVFWT
jgi:hypothetical protein